jgi:hypothetical protein
MSVQVTVSSERFDDKCHKVAESLQKAGVATALIVPGITTIGRKGTEQACVVTLPFDEYGAGPGHKDRLADMWSRISADLGITCAFLKIDNRFAGCILNFLRPSACDFLKHLPLQSDLGSRFKCWFS